MNRFILLIGTIMIGAVTLAAGVETNYYVKNTGEISNCKKIQFGTNDLKVECENGTILTIPKENIKAIRLNAVYYEKLPVFENNLKTDREEFMQFVKTRAGLRLYKYTAEIGNASGSAGFNVQGNKMDHFLVFKGDQFFVEITEKNYPTLFEFFGIAIKES